MYHLSKVKVLLLHKDEDGEVKKLFRVPSHIHYAIPDPLSCSLHSTHLTNR